MESCPQAIRPGNSQCPGLPRKNVTVRAASYIGSTWTAPSPPFTPLGRSTAITVLPGKALRTANASPSGPLESPAPKIASITMSAPSSIPVSSGSTFPPKVCDALSASPFRSPRSPSNPKRTVQPRSAIRRPTTNPSPPLLPGPHRMATFPVSSPNRSRAALQASSATAKPAASINSIPGVPPLIVKRSASPSSSGVKSACWPHWVRSIPRVSNIVSSMAGSFPKTAVD